MSKLPFIGLFAALVLGLSSQASASLMLEKYEGGTDGKNPTPTTVGGYSMTDFAFNDLTSGSTDNVASPTTTGGTVDFKTCGTPVSINLNYNTADDTSWWVNGETFNYDIFTTGTSCIVLEMPTNTLAFSFNVGADLTSTGQNAWLTAEAISGAGVSKYKFNVNKTNTPGYGIYANNDGVTNSSDCSYVSSITIDPLEWGFGNYSISQGSCDIPEPSTLPLLALGMLISLGLMRRRIKK